MTASLIGDTQHAAVKPVAAGLLAHIVTQADIEDKTSNLNDTLVSGKAAGMTFVMKNTTGTTYDLVIAEGSADVSPWDRVSDGGTTPITPA